MNLTNATCTPPEAMTQHCHAHPVEFTLAGSVEQRQIVVGARHHPKLVEYLLQRDSSDLMGPLESGQHLGFLAMEDGEFVARLGGELDELLRLGNFHALPLPLGLQVGFQSRQLFGMLGGHCG